MSSKIVRDDCLKKLIDQAEKLSNVCAAKQPSRNIVRGNLINLRFFYELTENAHYQYLSDLEDEEQDEALTEQFFTAIEAMDEAVELAEDVLESILDSSEEVGEKPDGSLKHVIKIRPSDEKYEVMLEIANSELKIDENNVHINGNEENDEDYVETNCEKECPEDDTVEVIKVCISHLSNNGEDGNNEVFHNHDKKVDVVDIDIDDNNECYVTNDSKQRKVVGVLVNENAEGELYEAFRDNDDDENHVKEVQEADHTNPEVVRDELNSEKDESSFKSHSTLSLKYSLKNSMHRKHERKKSCQLCGNRMITAMNLKSHTRTHRRGKCFRCKHCDVIYQSNGLLREPPESEHDISCLKSQRLKCCKCGQIKEYFSVLKNHFIVFTGDHECEIQFADESSLIYQHGKHVPEKIMCIQCEHKNEPSDTFKVHNAACQDTKECACLKREHSDGIVNNVRVHVSLKHETEADNLDLVKYVENERDKSEVSNRASALNSVETITKDKYTMVENAETEYESLTYDPCGCESFLKMESRKHVEESRGEIAKCGGFNILFQSNVCMRKHSHRKHVRKRDVHPLKNKFEVTYFSSSQGTNSEFITEKKTRNKKTCFPQISETRQCPVRAWSTLFRWPSSNFYGDEMSVGVSGFYCQPFSCLSAVSLSHHLQVSPELSSFHTISQWSEFQPRCIRGAFLGPNWNHTLAGLYIGCPLSVIFEPGYEDWRVSVNEN